MIPETAPAPSTTITLPDIPALCVNARAAYMLSNDGELKTLPHAQAAALIHKKPVLVCHAPFCRARLGNDVQFATFDVLELFAFVHPATFSTPTINGLCKTLGLAKPTSLDDAPMSLLDITRALLGDLRQENFKRPLSLEGGGRGDGVESYNTEHPHPNPPPQGGGKNMVLEIARVMGLNGKGWAWTPFVFSALGETYDEAVPVNSKTGLNIWKNLPEWAEEAPPPPASHHGVTEDEARERLIRLLGPEAEKREEQIDYASMIAKAFTPPSTQTKTSPPSLEGGGKGEGVESNNIEHPHPNPPPQGGGDRFIIGDKNIPHIILAEAGTGVGKTLGYLAPASVWAEKNQGTVWISTYTKNLQRQIDQELDRLYPNPELKAVHVATRKGRENYLCLLNLEEAAAGAALAKHPDAAIAAGIMARWTAATKDGDLTGSDYPGWLSGLLGYRHSAVLADRRGECIYSACDHYHKCFVERSVRSAAHARIVVANHALVMISAALATSGEDMPTRYVFDEGHHLFDAADSAFAAHLTARETRDLRRWILGNESGRRASRARGLKRRAEDLTEGMQEAEELLRKILNAAECLPMDGWTRRLRDGFPSGPTEQFLAQIYKQVHARADGRDGPYSLETELFPIDPDVLTAAHKLKTALADLQKPMQSLARIFQKKLANDEGLLDADTRKRLEALSASLQRRATLTLQAWIAMLENLDTNGPPSPRGRAECSEGGEHFHQNASHDMIEKSQQLRKNLTQAEENLWLNLNHKQLGVKFRRQHPIDNYITDFACPEKKLIIEIDGGQHSEQGQYDQTRTAYLQSKGYRVLRFWNNEVLQNTDGVLQTIINHLGSPPPRPSPQKGEGLESATQFIDWMEIERVDGHAVDVGLYRHHIDPMQPFASSIRPHIHGMAVTSATLRDSSQEDQADWTSALKRTGAAYLNPGAKTHSFASPFDYANQTKIFVINDVNKHNLDQVAGAYRALFKAAGGGALGLFTAISRLRAVQARIAGELENAGLPLYAQHIDEIDTGTLVDMFREDEHACLLGTDAIRDGVDVPGNALRLIVFDRVPWPRPTILHKARREAFGGRAYDETITRLKLKQAFGRLIRSESDKGVFVMLDSGLPTRLQSAFPKNVEIVKTGLSKVTAAIQDHLGT